MDPLTAQAEALAARRIAADKELWGDFGDPKIVAALHEEIRQIAYEQVIEMDNRRRRGWRTRPL